MRHSRAFGALTAVLAWCAAGSSWADWAAMDHRGSAWETTGAARDLDLEVRRGARILQGADGCYVRATHRQYPSTCGPASLAMVLKHFGPDPAAAVLPRDVDHEGEEMLDLGYPGSPEHITWWGYRRRRLGSGDAGWPATAAAPCVMTPDGRLNTGASPHPLSRLARGRDMDYLRFPEDEGGVARIPVWLWNCPAIGCGGDRDASSGLTGIMNYVFSGSRRGPWRDAMPLTLHGRSGPEVEAVRRLFKGFIDHDIPLVLGVESGGHFNVLIGYRGEASDPDFRVYTADPLDGWGRSAGRQPETWRRIRVSREVLFEGSGLLHMAICWNHHSEGPRRGFAPGGWAGRVDRLNGNGWLTGKDRIPPPDDPLGDPMARPLERAVVPPTG